MIELSVQKIARAQCMGECVAAGATNVRVVILQPEQDLDRVYCPYCAAFSMRVTHFFEADGTKKPRLEIVR